MELCQTCAPALEASAATPSSQREGRGRCTFALEASVATPASRMEGHGPCAPVLKNGGARLLRPCTGSLGGESGLGLADGGARTLCSCPGSLSGDSGFANARVRTLRPCPGSLGGNPDLANGEAQTLRLHPGSLGGAIGLKNGGARTVRLRPGSPWRQLHFRRWTGAHPALTPWKAFVATAVPQIELLGRLPVDGLALALANSGSGRLGPGRPDLGLG